jgi:uncharacterized membrane protein YheB (UPF0754 family)
VGPVPDRHREEVYKRFKKACDSFFQRRRAHYGEVESEYKDNLKKKEEICTQLEQMVANNTVDDAEVKKLMQEYEATGYVPKQNMRALQKRYSKALAAATEQSGISEEEQHKMKFKAQFSNVKYGPESDRFVQRKENMLRRQISKLENDINLWQNNLDFFADSRKADKLKEEFGKKIDQAGKELKDLKDQLKILSNI